MSESPRRLVITTGPDVLEIRRKASPALAQCRAYAGVVNPRFGAASKRTAHTDHSGFLPHRYPGQELMSWSNLRSAKFSGSGLERSSTAAVLVTASCALRAAVSGFALVSFASRARVLVATDCRGELRR